MPNPESKSSLPRYHSIDSLRAVTMLLVLIFHVAIVYIPFDTDLVPYQDAQRSPLLGWVVLFTRLFHMPIFFLVAGFFAAFLYQSRGAGGFLSHRLKRVGLPLLCCWLVIYPLLLLCEIYTQVVIAQPPQDVGGELLSIAQKRGINLWHLWFLYQLMLLCIIAVPVVFLTRVLPQPARTVLLNACQRVTPRFAGVLLWAFISGLTLYLPGSIFLFDVDTSLLPPLWALAGNGVFVAFGWLLYQYREALAGFKRPAWGYFIAGVILHGVYLYLTSALGHTHIVTIACLALTVWLLIYGLLGLFLRYLEGENAIRRYIADASFWIYVSHPPVLAVLAPLLSFWALPALVKFTIVTAGTVAVTAITYHYWVRATFIGAMLNGRRLPRVVPWSR